MPIGAVRFAIFHGVNVGAGGKIDVVADARFGRQQLAGTNMRGGIQSPCQSLLRDFTRALLAGLKRSRKSMGSLLGGLHG